MTANKPPDKTLVGMPADLKAVLQKLDQAVADKATLIDQPPAKAPVDHGKTRMGHAPSADRPRSAPPPLPSQRPAAAPAPQLPAGPSPAPNAGAGMDRTLIGMPAEEMQAALQRALVEVGAPPAQPAYNQPAQPQRAPMPQQPQPRAAEPVQPLRAQPVRAIGIAGAPQPEAQVPAQRGHQAAPSPAQGARGHQHGYAPPAPGHGAVPPSTAHVHQAAPGYGSVPPSPAARGASPAAAHGYGSMPPSAASPAAGHEAASGYGAAPPPAAHASSPAGSYGAAPGYGSAPPSASSPVAAHGAVPGYSSAPPPAAQAYQHGQAQGYGSPSAQAGGLGHSGVPQGSGLGYQSGPGYQEPAQPGATAMKVLAPQAPLDWPPAARRSDSGPFPRPELGSAPGAQPQAASAPPPMAASPAQPSAPRLGTDVAAPPAAAMSLPRPELSLGNQATRVAQPDLDGVSARAAGTAQSPRLALPLKTLDGSQQRTTSKKSAEAPPKRWPAISLILLAVVAFGGVIVLRAPHLLPAPLSSLLAPASAAPYQPLAPEASGAPELPSVPVAEVATDTSAATDPTKAAPTPTPTRPPAAPAMTSGPSAQLEKKAIERLIANDYVNAKQLYEKLRSAEPSRSEFGVMVELLNRASAAPCGQPGQAPCAGARP